MSSAHALYWGDGKQILFHLLGDFAGGKERGEGKGIAPLCTFSCTLEPPDVLNIVCLLVFGENCFLCVGAVKPDFTTMCHMHAMSQILSYFIYWKPDSFQPLVFTHSKRT